jgi:hypothetical protein
MSTKQHEIPEELLSSLLASYQKPDDLIGENGLLKQLTKLVVERALEHVQGSARLRAPGCPGVPQIVPAEIRSPLFQSFPPSLGVDHRHRLTLVAEHLGLTLSDRAASDHHRRWR